MCTQKLSLPQEIKTENQQIKLKAHSHLYKNIHSKQFMQMTIYTVITPR